MILDREVTPTATNSGDASHPRKRRRKISVPIPDSVPARHTRSQTILTPTATRTFPHPLPEHLPLVHPPAKAKKKVQAVTKPANQVYRYLPRDMPDDLGGLPVRFSWPINSFQDCC